MRVRASWLLVVSSFLSAALVQAAYQESFTFTTPAGSPYNPGFVDGTNNNGQFYAPAGAVLDAATNLYVVDGRLIRRISPAGTNWSLKTLAGDPAISGDKDGTNNGAQFRVPQGIAVDAGGTLYVADTQNHTIRKV